MAGLMSPSRMLFAAAMALMLAWPGQAQAGWFVRDNEIAYRLARQGHDGRALQYWDHSAEGLYGKGTALMHLGRIREAEQAFRDALALAPHKTGFSDQLEMPVNQRPHFMASVWYNLGNALYAQGELAAARDAWLQALALEPGHAKASHNLKIVDRLLGARERDAQPPPTGLPGSGKHKPGKGGNQAASPSQPQQHASLPLHMPGRAHQVSGASAAGRKKAGAKHGGSGAGGASPQQTARHASSPHAPGGAGHASSAGDGHQGREPAAGQGMSRREAVEQLRMVEEGVSVFLRHRLGEKGRESSADGGKPW